MYSSMAVLTASSASTFVSARHTHAGRLGHSAIQSPRDVLKTTTLRIVFRTFLAISLDCYNCGGRVVQVTVVLRFEIRGAGLGTIGLMYINTV